MAVKIGNGGPNTLIGTTARDTLDGRGGADRLSGLLGGDLLKGVAGNDILDGGSGNDTMQGGLGNDTYVVDALGDITTELAGQGTDTVQSSIARILSANVENLTLTGTADLNGTGNALNNVVLGNSGRNVLSGLLGNDRLVGGGGNDVLSGAAGNDTMTGGTGDDTMIGGAGNDTYVVADAGDVFTEVAGAGIDTVMIGSSHTLGAVFENLVLTGNFAVDGTGNAAANEITGNNAKNTLSGRDGDDSLVGGGGNDRLLGGNGNDSLDGGVGGDSMIGGLGNDTYTVNAAGDAVTEAANGGRDTIRGTINLTLGDNVENLVLTGNANLNGTGNGVANVMTGNNVLIGLGGGDRLNGDAGDDSLIGGGGVDRLNGGAGNDRMVGGAGNDILNGGEGTRDAAEYTGFLGDFTVTTGATTTVAGAQGTDTLTNTEILSFSDLNLDIGGATAVAFVDLGRLSGGRGFRLDGVDTNDFSGNAVASAGDLNGDGFDDIVIGARNSAGSGASSSGEVYVVFGSASAGANVDLGALTGTNGFRLTGIDAGDFAGKAVNSAGDINGDGIDDLLIGAYKADGSGTNAGEVYVVFGKTTAFSAAIDLGDIDGNNGFVIRGAQAEDRAGFSVKAVGDVNGDGIDDIIIGAPENDSTNDPDPGEAYVVFGSAGGLPATLDLGALDGTNGFKLDGIDAADFVGSSVSGGDFNGDGLNDIIVGAAGADPGGVNYAGESYVLFGKSTAFAATVDLGALGADGVRILASVSGASGFAVDSAGDWNGDNIDDMAIGAFLTDAGGRTGAGAIYIVFGATNLGAAGTIVLGNLVGTDGFVLNGIDSADLAGVSVALAGDVNGDGFDDIIVGARGADPHGATGSGEAYVIFGGTTFGATGSAELSALTPEFGFRIDGIDPQDAAGFAVDGVGDINGDGFDDLIVGASLADPGGDADAGESYVIFGRDFSRVVDDDGTTGNDVITVGAGDQIIIGGLGNDTLDGGAGNDVLIGGAGNDVLVFDANDGLRVDGGGGTDTLQVGGDLNLTTYNQTAHYNILSNLEVIALSTNANVTLTFDTNDMFNLSDSSNTLTITGDAGDAVVTSGWIQGASAGGFTAYTHGDATLQVADAIDRTGITV